MSFQSLLKESIRKIELNYHGLAKKEITKSDINIVKDTYNKNKKNWFLPQKTAIVITENELNERMKDLARNKKLFNETGFIHEKETGILVALTNPDNLRKNIDTAKRSVTSGFSEERIDYSSFEGKLIHMHTHPLGAYKAFLKNIVKPELKNIESRPEFPVFSRALGGKENAKKELKHLMIQMKKSEGFVALLLPAVTDVKGWMFNSLKYLEELQTGKIELGFVVYTPFGKTEMSFPNLIKSKDPITSAKNIIKEYKIKMEAMVNYIAYEDGYRTFDLKTIKSKKKFIKNFFKNDDFKLTFSR